MKKFVRSKIKNLHDSIGAQDITEPKGVVVNPGAPSISGYPSSDPLESLKRQLDILASENAKLKTSIQRLSDDNLYLHNQLEALSLNRAVNKQQTSGQPGGANKNVQPFDNDTEIRQSIQNVLLENENLHTKLQSEIEQTKISTLNYEKEIQRLTTMVDDSGQENAKLQRNIENALFEIDNLHMQIDVWKKESETKLSFEEFRAKFETANAMLDDLQAKYTTDINRLNEVLANCQNDKKNIALKLAQMEAVYNDNVSKNAVVEKKFTKVSEDNKMLNETLLEFNKKLAHSESTLNDLLALCQDLMRKKQLNEQIGEQRVDLMENRLKKLETKCQQLKEENLKLKHYKTAASVKLKQAKQYLQDEENFSSA